MDERDTKLLGSTLAALSVGAGMMAAGMRTGIKKDKERKRYFSKRKYINPRKVQKPDNIDF